MGCDKLIKAVLFVSLAIGSCFAQGGTPGSVKKVTGTAPITSTGGNQPVIACAACAVINAGNVFSSGLQDFSAVDIKLHIAAGLTETTNGQIGYDSTSNNYHAGVSAADTVVATVPTATPVNGDCAKWSVVTGKIQLGDAGAACGAGGGSGYATIQADGTSLTQRATANAQDWITAVDDSGNTRTNLQFRPNLRKLFVIEDEFMDDALGELKWDNFGPAATASVSVDGRPGVAEYATSSTSSSIAGIALGSNIQNTNGRVDNLPWSMHWGVRVNTLTQVTVRFGWTDGAANSDPPANGMYLENVTGASAGNWVGVSRASSTSSTTANGATLDGSFHDYEIRSTGSSSVSFFQDGTQIGSAVTTNIPTASGRCFIYIKNTAATNSTIDLDYFSWAITVSR